MARPPASEQVQVNFRMPADLKERIEAAARENNRSTTAEIVVRLNESFEQPPAAGEQTLYVVLDANGHPQSWDETFEHLRAIRKAGGFNPSTVNTVLYNGPRLSSTAREEQADELVRWYRQFMRKHPVSRPRDD